MKFVVSSSALSSHLQIISRVLNSKNVLPILDCFLFELSGSKLIITASDGDTTLSTKVDVDGLDQDEDLSLAIPARTLLDALRELADQPLTFDMGDGTGTLVIRYKNGSYNLVYESAEEFPVPVLLTGSKNRLEIDSASLQDGISKVIFATADDDMRPVMNGLFFDITQDATTIVASDGHKLGKYKTFTSKADEMASFIFPKKPATLLKGILQKEEGKVRIEFDDKNAYIRVGDYNMVCRFIEGRYPNYSVVIPKNNPYLATVDRLSLLSALRRVSIFSPQESSLVKFSVEKDSITLSTQDFDFSTSAEEQLTCQYDGSPLAIGFKGTFLIDILNNMTSQNVNIEMADSSRPALLIPTEQEDGKDLLMLIMPMMLSH